MNIFVRPWYLYGKLKIFLSGISVAFTSPATNVVFKENIEEVKRQKINIEKNIVIMLGIQNKKPNWNVILKEEGSHVKVFQS